MVGRFYDEMASSWASPGRRCGLSPSIGLCFGAGQTVLGIAASALGVLVLSGLRRFEHLMEQDQQGTLTLTTAQAQPTGEEIQSSIRQSWLQDQPSLGRSCRSNPAARTRIQIAVARRARAFNHSPVPTRVGRQPTYSVGRLEGLSVIAPSLSDYCSRRRRIVPQVEEFTRAVSN